MPVKTAMKNAAAAVRKCGSGEENKKGKIRITVILKKSDKKPLKIYARTGVL